MSKTKRQKTLSIILAVFYMLLLTWVILLKMQTSVENLDSIRNINLIPFHESMITNDRINLQEILYNIVVFVPMGIYTALIWPEWSFIRKVLPCFTVSLLFELLQFVFAIGASDITDLIGNTLGGILGIIFFCLLQKLLKEKTTVLVNTMALVFSVLAVILQFCLFFANA